MFVRTARNGKPPLNVHLAMTKKKNLSSHVLQSRQMYTHIHVHIFLPGAVTQQNTHQFNFSGGSRDHDLDGRHHPDEKISEIKRKYSWQRKLKVPAVG